MAVRARSVNPRVIEWARKTAGLTQEGLADLLGRNVEEIKAWELGDSAPTYRQLESLASRLKRPIAVFFFSVVPDEPDPDAEFRTLPITTEVEAVRDTRIAIRDALAKQMRVLELSKGSNPAGDSFLLSNLDSAWTADSVRGRLGIEIDDQMSWRSSEEAFGEWRQAVESVGVFVFKRALKQMEISGLCVPHNVAPVILINNTTSWTRQIFTLFHELAHVLKGLHGVTRADDGYVSSLVTADLRIERECNEFAAELLLPPSSFDKHSVGMVGTDEDVETLASLFNVSREVVLRRLIDLGRVDGSDYQRRVAGWTGQYFARSAEGSGGNYYATQASYLGQAYLDLAFGSYYSGESTVAQLAEHLSIRAANVGKLEEFVYRGAS